MYRLHKGHFIAFWSGNLEDIFPLKGYPGAYKTKLYVIL